MLDLNLFNMHVVGKCFPTLSYTISYFHHRHKFPNLNHPSDLSEIWYKKVLDGYYMNYYELADKYAVRNYVQIKGYSEILPKLIAHYESADQVDFTKLPNRFALKMNFGAGMNIICMDKNKLNTNIAIQDLKKWFKVDEYNPTEKHYSLIKKQAVCEEFIEDGNGGFPIDYKFMCIRGKVVCVLACSGRERGFADYLPYSLDWQPLYNYYIGFDDTTPLVEKPHNLAEMIKCAEDLAGELDLVRIDLYSNNERIWFGEITLTPSGCIFHRWSNYALDEMGHIYRNQI